MMDGCLYLSVAHKLFPKQVHTNCIGMQNPQLPRINQATPPSTPWAPFWSLEYIVYYFRLLFLLSTTTTPSGPLSTLSSLCFSIIHSNFPSLLSQSNMGWSDGDDDKVTFCSFEMWSQFGREVLSDAEYEDFDDGDANNAGAHGLKWIQDWYGVFFVVTVGQFFSDNLRLCAFIHHGKVSPFGYHCHSLFRLFHHHDHFSRSIFVIIWSYGFQPV